MVNLLAAGKVPQQVSKYMAGASVIALTKDKPNSAPDIRPIAVGEVLGRLVGKCLCLLSHEKAANFFQPFQYGVTCPGGAEKMIHKLRHCVDNHWSDGNFVLLKVDMTNAFNLVSRQTFLEECSKHFSELLSWSSWCYGRHPSLWHVLGILSSEVGVQQGDPLGPLLFSAALQKLILSIHNDKSCTDLRLNVWYLDDEVLAGHPTSVSQALDIIQSDGPPLGFHVNLKKCELFSPSDTSLFPTSIPSSNIPNFKLLGVPIGDTAFCSNFITIKCSSPSALLSQLEEIAIGSSDPHVALSLLRHCASFCKLIHLARGTPSVSAVEALKDFDLAVANCFTKCTGLDLSVDAWKQAQLSPRRGGLGLCPLSPCPGYLYLFTMHL